MCDAPILYRASAVIARKPHRCVECGRQIVAGEMHEYVRYVRDGSPVSAHTCTECFEVRAELFEDMPSGEETECALAFGMLRETLAEQIQETAA